MDELARADIEQRTVREVELLLVLGRLTKERDLKAEALTCSAVEMSGDIPPFRAELWVAAVVTREVEDASGLRDGEAVAGGLGLAIQAKQKQSDQAWSKDASSVKAVD